MNGYIIHKSLLDFDSLNWGLAMYDACCFTGHRPHKYATRGDMAQARLKDRLALEILRLYERGIRTYHTGMARGADMLAAECVLELRKTYTDMRLVAVVPFRGQPDRWVEDDQARYYHILAYANRRVFLYDEYTPGCFHARNRYMVDNSFCVLAVYNGAPGGTQYTLQYASKHNREIILLEPD